MELSIQCSFFSSLHLSLKITPNPQPPSDYMPTSKATKNSAKHFKKHKSITPISCPLAAGSNLSRTSKGLWKISCPPPSHKNVSSKTGGQRWTHPLNAGSEGLKLRNKINLSFNLGLHPIKLWSNYFCLFEPHFSHLKTGNHDHIVAHCRDQISWCLEGIHDWGWLLINSYHWVTTKPLGAAPGETIPSCCTKVISKGARNAPQVYRKCQEEWGWVQGPLGTWKTKRKKHRKERQVWGCCLPVYKARVPNGKYSSREGTREAGLIHENRGRCWKTWTFSYTAKWLRSFTPIDLSACP